MSILESFFDSVNSLGPFEEKCNLAVALSGGSDSLALTILLSEWSKLNNYSLTALLVDHNLRIEAKNEIAYTIEILRQKKINYNILNINSNKIGKSNIQEQARISRYNLLTKYCKQNDIIHLFTGHTCDDQIENFFIRLSRGSSLNGLSGIKKIFIQNEIRILRPIVGFYKEDLQNFLRSQNIKWIEDPSNQNNDFTRVKARELVNSQKFLEISNQANQRTLFNRIKNVIDEIKDTTKKNEDSLLSFLTENITCYPEGYCKLNAKLLNNYKKNIVIRAISHIIRTVGNHDSFHLPRLVSLEELYNNINKETSFKKTLGNCVVKFNNKNNNLMFLPENKDFTCDDNKDKSLTVNNRYKLCGFKKDQIVKFHSNKNTVSHLPVEIRRQLFEIELLNGKKVISFIGNEHYNGVQLEFFPQVGLAENHFDN